MEAPQPLQASDWPAGCAAPAPASAQAPPGLPAGKAGLRISARPLVPRYTDFDPTCDDGQAWRGSAALQECKGKPHTGPGSATHTPSPVDVYEATTSAGAPAPMAAALASDPGAETAVSAGPSCHQSHPAPRAAEASPGRQAACLSIQQASVSTHGGHSYHAASVMYVQTSDAGAEIAGAGILDPSCGLFDAGAAAAGSGLGLLDETDVFAPKWDAPFRCPLSAAGGRGFLGALSLLHPHLSPSDAAGGLGAEDSTSAAQASVASVTPLPHAAGSVSSACTQQASATASSLRGTLKIQLPRLPLAAGADASRGGEQGSHSMPTTGRGSEDAPRSVRLNLQADVLTFTPKSYMSFSSTSSSTSASPCCSEPGSDTGTTGCTPALDDDESPSRDAMKDEDEDEEGAAPPPALAAKPAPLTLKPALPASTGLVLSRVHRRGAARTVRPGDESETPGSSEEARGGSGEDEDGDDPMSGSSSNASTPSARCGGGTGRRKYANELAPNMLAGTACHAQPRAPQQQQQQQTLSLSLPLSSAAAAPSAGTGTALGLPPLSVSAPAATGTSGGRPAGIGLSLRAAAPAPGATAAAAGAGAPLRLPPGAALRCADNSDSDASDEAGSIRRIKPPRSSAAAGCGASSMLGLGGAPTLTMSWGSSISETVVRSRGDSAGDGSSGLRLSAAATGGGGPAPAPGSPDQHPPAAAAAAAAYQYFYYAARLPTPVVGLGLGGAPGLPCPAPPPASAAAPSGLAAAAGCGTSINGTV